MFVGVGMGWGTLRSSSGVERQKVKKQSCGSRGRTFAGRDRLVSPVAQELQTVDWVFFVLDAWKEGCFPGAHPWMPMKFQG